MSYFFYIYFSDTLGKVFYDNDATAVTDDYEKKQKQQENLLKIEKFINNLIYHNNNNNNNKKLTLGSMFINYDENFAIIVDRENTDNCTRLSIKNGILKSLLYLEHKLYKKNEHSHTFMIPILFIHLPKLNLMNFFKEALLQKMIFDSLDNVKIKFV